jgi:hypothetical protein
MRRLIVVAGAVAMLAVPSVADASAPDGTPGPPTNEHASLIVPHSKIPFVGGRVVLGAVPDPTTDDASDGDLAPDDPGEQ